MTSALSVCFVSPTAYGYFNPDVGFTGGGSQRQLYLLSQELKDEIDVHFVVGDYGQSKTERRDGVTIHRSHASDHSSSVTDKTRKAARLFDAMRRANTDIYVDRNVPTTAVVTYLVARTLGQTWVYNVGSDGHVGSRRDDLAAPLRRAFDHALASADGVIAQSAHQAERVDELYGTRTAVVPNGYPSTDEGIPYAEREGVLWVGRLKEYPKQPHLFLDVAERYSAIEFDVIGPQGPDPAYHDRLVDRMADLDNVTYHGPVDPTAIHAHYRSAVALVNTSAYEGFPNTFLESWRVGTPVVSLNVPFTKLESAMDVPGYVDGDVDRLGEMIAELVASVERRAGVGRSSRERFESTLSITDIAADYARALRSFS